MISIVIPTLGTREGMLKEAIASVRAQRHVDDIQLTIVAPTTALRNLGELDVDCYVAEDRPGLSTAINTGWRQSPGDSYAWLGDDDLLCPNSVSTASRVLVSSHAGAVYGRCLIIDERGDAMHEIRPGRFGAWLASFGPNLIPQPGALFAGEVLRDVGWLDEGLDYAMDLDLFLRIRKRSRLTYVPQVLAAFRRHAGSLTVLKRNPYEETDRVQLRYLNTNMIRLHSRTRTASRLLGKLLNRYYASRYQAS